jgi:hypothetical protein
MVAIVKQQQRGRPDACRRSSSGGWWARWLWDGGASWLRPSIGTGFGLHGTVYDLVGEP